MSDTILILGGSGQVGSEVCATYVDANVIAPSHAELPLDDLDRIEEVIVANRPRAVINCTAFHQVDACEVDPARAFHVNATLVGRLSAICAAREITFATISTDYVFSGDDGRAYGELDRAAPKNVYGVSKLAGEHYALLANARALVFRTSGVFGRSGYSNKGPTFVERMISMAERGETPSVVENIVFSPSYAPDVAAKMREVIDTQKAGLYHVANAGSCSWYELAVEAIARAGLRSEVRPTRYEVTAGALGRPMYSPLAPDALSRDGFDAMPSWQDAVSRYVDQRKARLA
ncbi:MAG TPA: dTDP-4-dehydrorhamnose reductase [Candidatus Baltobacteraceae bacterium]|nr:dTDP-4-dehydrorhamnose reductase [Candidatus Baltobacteraceae bacterium]